MNRTLMEDDRRHRTAVHREIDALAMLFGNTSAVYHSTSKSKPLSAKETSTIVSFLEFYLTDPLPRLP
jgi:hypothetical protein